MKVFIAGPRAVKALSESVIEILSRIKENQLTVLVGDANGVDRLVQKYFADEQYPNVHVYASNGRARNNVGGWTVNNVKVLSNVKGFNFYAQKDIQMAQDADNGFMIWNGKSKGTLNNIINLTAQNKKIKIYFMPDKKTYCISNIEDVENLAKHMGADTLKLFYELSPNNSDLIENHAQLSLFEINQHEAETQFAV
jgi:hypothetical protein